MQYSLIRMWSTLKKFTNMDLNSEFQNLKRQWDSYDQGVIQWNVINSLKETVPNAAILPAALGNGQMQIWVDETGNNLTFQVKYSTGTVKSGTVALT